MFIPIEWLIVLGVVGFMMLRDAHADDKEAKRQNEPSYIPEDIDYDAMDY